MAATIPFTLEKQKNVEEVVAVGPRSPAIRLSLEWLAAAGIVAGMGATALVVHHYDATHATQEAAPNNLQQALVSARPRFMR